VKSNLEKRRAQVKSRWYYIFWGTATVAVVSGQIYVGTGYRFMSEAFHRVLDTLIIEVEKEPYRKDEYQFL
tara:strand:+ start:221 stop:433 length:213 start_codon:yes stop_codon:yes gene_type:complete